MAKLIDNEQTNKVLDIASSVKADELINKIKDFTSKFEQGTNYVPEKNTSFERLDNIQIDDEFIRFYIYSEDRVGDGIFPYSRFMECMMMAELEYFDSEHIIIPPLSKEQIEELVELL